MAAGFCRPSFLVLALPAAGRAYGDGSEVRRTGHGDGGQGGAYNKERVYARERGFYTRERGFYARERVWNVFPARVERVHPLKMRGARAKV